MLDITTNLTLAILAGKVLAKLPSQISTFHPSSLFFTHLLSIFLSSQNYWP